MFRRYTIRPDQTQAIHVTAGNYPEVADWIGAHIATDKGVQVIHPGSAGQGRPRLQFFPPDADRPVLVSIPGYLQRDTDRVGRVYYQADSTGAFAAHWQLADD